MKKVFSVVIFISLGFICKAQQKPYYSQYILNVDCFNDINLSNETNDIKTFCKTIKNYKKFIIIDNFDIINENNQQYIKMLIDSLKTETNDVDDDEWNF